MQHTDKTYNLPASLCLFALVIRIALSPALLALIGIPYEGETGGNLFLKIHPSTWLIFLSFLLLLAQSGNPLRQTLVLFKQNKTFSYVLLAYFFVTFYWAVRNPVGIGTMIDTHLTAPLCALIFSTASRDLCRRTLSVLIVLTLFNSIIGIGESILRLRLFPYDAAAVFEHEDQFRASALLGHPLNNALFTSVMLPLAMNFPMPKMIKAVLLLLFFTALVAFGGRAALIISSITLIPLGVAAFRHSLQKPTPSVQRLIGLLAAVVLVPLILSTFLYGIIISPIGERIVSLSHFHDNSTQVRWLSFRVFEFMSNAEILLGVSTNRVVQIADHMGRSLPIQFIENPWIIMLMLLGVVMFPVWFVATMAFARRLLHHSNLGARLAVLSYFIVASGSNSFGRKELIFAIMTAAVVCVQRMEEPP